MCIFFKKLFFEREHTAGEGQEEREREKEYSKSAKNGLLVTRA